MYRSVLRHPPANPWAPVLWSLVVQISIYHEYVKKAHGMDENSPWHRMLDINIFFFLPVLTWGKRYQNFTSKTVHLPSNIALPLKALLFHNITKERTWSLTSSRFFAIWFQGKLSNYSQPRPLMSNHLSGHSAVGARPMKVTALTIYNFLSVYKKLQGLFFSWNLPSFSALYTNAVFLWVVTLLVFFFAFYTKQSASVVSLQLVFGLSRCLYVGFVYQIIYCFFFN